MGRNGYQVKRKSNYEINNNNNININNNNFILERLRFYVERRVAVRYLYLFVFYFGISSVSARIVRH